MKYWVKKAALTSAAFLAIAPARHAQGMTNMLGAVSSLCRELYDIVPVISMLLVIAAGVTYAAGNIFGAETRARAATWASAMLIGAVIGILIIAVAPSILSAMYGCDLNCGGAILLSGRPCGVSTP